jgi:hypothetical protein
MCNDQFAALLLLFLLLLAAYLLLFISFLSICVIRYMPVYSGSWFNPIGFAELRWTLHNGIWTLLQLIQENSSLERVGPIFCAELPLNLLLSQQQGFNIRLAAT